MDKNDMICPFCSESDFDAIGLKHHLLSGGCVTFNAVITIEQERHRTKQSSEPSDSCEHNNVTIFPNGDLWCEECKRYITL